MGKNKSSNAKKRNNKRGAKRNKYKKERKLAEKKTIEENVEEKVVEEGSLKRVLPEESDQSDVEVQPKKKKKQPTTADTSDGNSKGKKSIRQMKREKHAQRLAESEAIAKDELKSQCLSYLSQWKHDKQNWKFMKAKQVWLYKNKFSAHLVPDSSWKTLLEYFESAQGNIRNLLLEDSNKVIKKMDEWSESQNNKGEKEPVEDKEEETASDAPESEKPDETSYKRARDLIQCLQE